MRHDVREGPKRDRSEEALRSLLARHEAELALRKQVLREELALEPGEGRGNLDSSPDTVARGVGAALVEVTARTVQSIQGALRRMSAGAYGRCLDCETPIPTVRLQALPFAERCRDCQQHQDSARRRAPLLA